MAFVSMIFIYVVAMCIIGVISFIIGLILFIAGILKRRKPQYIGKKSPIVCIIIGFVFFAIPVSISLALTIIKTIDKVSSSIKNTEYDNLVDEWRNEGVPDRDKAALEAVQELLKAADAGDREKFASIFTPNVQKNENFKPSLDAFFNSYPVGLSQCDLDGSQVYGGIGSVESAGTSCYTCVLDGKWYRIDMYTCFEYTISPDDVGIKVLRIENLEANALERFLVNSQYGKDDYLICNLKSNEEMIDQLTENGYYIFYNRAPEDTVARLIIGCSYAFQRTPERVITEEQMREYLKKYKNLSELSSVIGEPNVKYQYMEDYYYEIVPENGELRYALIEADRTNGIISRAYICSDEEYLFEIIDNS